MPGWLWLTLSCCWAAAGCTSGKGACQAPPDCAEGHECLAFRCVPSGGSPVPEQSERVLMFPSALGTDVAAELSGAITLGPTGASALYAAFELPKTGCERLDSAFLLLDTEVHAQAPPAPVTLSVRRVRRSWSPSGLGSGNVPTDSLPEARGLVAPPLTARIDVTSLVCNALELPARHHGLVVRSVDGSLPLHIATGMTSAEPPRLELYLKAPRATAQAERDGDGW